MCEFKKAALQTTERLNLKYIFPPEAQVGANRTVPYFAILHLSYVYTKFQSKLQNNSILCI